MSSRQVWHSLALDALGNDGWIARWASYYGRVSASFTDTNGTKSFLNTANWTQKISVGYHWRFDRFTVAVAGGLIFNSCAEAPILNTSGVAVATLPERTGSPTLDTALGLAF